MGWYHVIKTIRGVPYHYKQRAWRENGKVRTECRCLGRVDGKGARNTTPTPSTTEPWRTELLQGLDEVQRRLAGDRFALDRLAALRCDNASRAQALTALRQLHDELFDSSTFARDHLLVVIAALSAFATTTKDTREPWRTTLCKDLGIAKTWMPTRALGRRIDDLLTNLETQSSVAVIAQLEQLHNAIAHRDDGPHVQALKQIESALTVVRTTTAPDAPPPPRDGILS